MLPPTHPLIAAAVAPLADNAEQQLAATALLEEKFDADHPGIPASLARFREIPATGRTRSWIIALHVLAALALIPSLLSIQALRESTSSLGFLNTMGSRSTPSPGLPKTLTAEQRLLIGDPKLPELRQKELLHLSDPDRADFYSEYAGKFNSENGILPRGYLETAARIDPQNSFFLYNTAGKVGGISVAKVKPATKAPERLIRGKRLPAIPAETEWTVSDEVLFEKTMGLISEAGKLSRYETYESSLAAQRLPLFDQDHFLPRIRTIAYFAGQTSQVISIRYVADLISARAYFLSQKGDTEAFLALHRDYEAFLRHLGNCPDSSLVSELVFAACASLATNNMYFGAERLGLTDLAAKLKERKDAFQADRDAKVFRESAFAEQVEREGTILTNLTGPSLDIQVANPPAPDPNALTAARLAEHDYASAVFSSLLAAVAAVFSFWIFLLSRTAPRPLRILAKRFSLLLGFRDWAWILGLGVIIPAALVLTLTRLTPLGGRETGISFHSFLFPLVHFELMLLLILTVPPLVLRWRLSGKIAPFGLATGFPPLWLVIPAFGTLAVLLAYPVLEALPKSGFALAALGCFPALWVMSLLWFGVLALIGRRSARLRIATCFHVLAPALSLAIILFCALGPLLWSSGERWTSRDNFHRVVPGGLGSYEATIAAQKRKEVKIILER
jgi:hypothetical protein